ncbi:MAG: HEPN domain-containing protein [Gammaproteobacteria bacterium]|nr:HEPN domain-containing protein [Gammaproteobacteria bacterium]MDE0302054.1 HEPN domain-containing protein [Gammaproteobacteria bacterium]
MSDPKLARVLLAAAERDMTALCGMGDVNVFANEIFGFHVQPAAEKILKANLALLGKPYPATHDLTRLFELLKTHQPETENRFGELIAYNPYAVQFRYSTSDPSLKPLDRDAAVQLLEAFLTWSRRNPAETE